MTTVKELIEKLKEYPEADGMCNFKAGWAGKCEENGDPFCDKHSKVRCRTCGVQAARHCSYSVSLVCGAPVCRNCQWCPTHGGKQPTLHP